MRLIILLILLLALVGCAAPQTQESIQSTGTYEEATQPVQETASAPETTTKEAPKQTELTQPAALPSVEVREYNGKRLDSIKDVRDVSIKGPQKVDITKYRLELTGLVMNPKELTYEEIISHTAYSKEVTLHCTEGWDADVLWEGVLLKDIIDKAEAKPEANTVIFHSVDGYTTSLPLEYITSRNILLAYKINNLTLTADTGYPFMVVAEDKLGYKWAKWVNKIELSDNPDYKGYWESRGYPNDANI